jgi:hypothetical protein
MKELLAVDYWLQHKIKPAKGFLPELEKKEKFGLLDAHKLPHHKFRYAAATLSFDFELWEKDNTIILKPTLLLMEFNGGSKPKILNISAQTVNT